MARILTFTINKDATVTGEAEGFHGQGCAEALTNMFAALGGQKIDGGYKPEYHEHCATKIKAGR